MPIVTIRLTKTEVALLDDLIKFHRSKSRSDAIRAAMMHFAESKKLKASARATIVSEREKHKPRRRLAPITPPP